MANITVVQHTGNPVASSTQNVITLGTTGSGNLIVVQTNIDGAGLFTSITDSASNTYTNFPSASDLVGNQNVTYYLFPSTAGIKSVTVHYSPSANSQMEVWEVSGWNWGAKANSGGVNASGVQSGGAATGPTVNPTQISGFIAALDHTSASISANPAAGNNFTAGGDLWNGSANGYVSAIITALKTYTPKWTDSGTSFISIVGSFIDNKNFRSRITSNIGTRGASRQMIWQ